MKNNTILTISALALSVFAAGCTSGGGKSSSFPSTTTMTAAATTPQERSTDGNSKTLEESEGDEVGDTLAPSYTKSVTGENTGDLTVTKVENGMEVTLGGKAYHFASDVLTSDDGTAKVLNESGIRLSSVRVVPFQFGSNLGDEANDVVEDIAVIVSGNKTSVSDLPSSVVNYSGTYVVGTLESNKNFDQDDDEISNTFSAKADFGVAKNISGTFYEADENDVPDEVGTLSGAITDNNFSGEITVNNEAGTTLPTNGSFYGPGGIEIAGTATGTLVEQDETINVVVGFAGAAD